MERMEIIRNTAEEVLAPVMVEYVKWILSRAQQLGIQRIYFLARDGWPMYRAACILSENRHPHIECRYLECSRYALRLPSFAIRKKDSLDQIFLDGIDVTLRKILARAAITGQEAVRAAQAAGASCDLDVILSRREIQRLKPLFFHCPLFWQLVEYHAAKALPAACGYLRQEGLFEDVRWAVADSGWTGSLQETLETLLRAEGYQREFCGFYFGLYQLPRDAKESGYHAYYFDVRGKIRRKARFSNSLFECVFSAPQGMTEGYRKNRQGQYVPIRRPALEENFPALRAVEQAVETRARQAAVRLPFSIRAWKLWPAGRIRCLLEPFMGNPTPLQARAFGSWKFTDDVLEDPRQEIAPLLGRRELRAAHLSGKLLQAAGLARRPARESAWIEGSVVRGGRNIRYHLFWIRMYKYALGLKKSALRRMGL